MFRHTGPLVLLLVLSSVGARAQVFVNDYAGWSTAASPTNTEPFDTDLGGTDTFLLTDSLVTVNGTSPMGTFTTHAVTGGQLDTTTRTSTGTNGYETVTLTFFAADHGGLVRPRQHHGRWAQPRVLWRLEQRSG